MCNRYIFQANNNGDCHDRMVVGFTTICAISAYHHYYVVSLNPTDGEVYLIQHYVIKIVLVFSWYSGFLHQLN